MYINGAGSGNDPSTGVVSPDIINIYDVDAGYNQNVHCSVSNNVITIEVDASKSRAESHSEFIVVDYLDTQLASFSVNQAANPNAPVPGLSHDGEMLVGNMMYYIARAMTTIDQLERMYAHNSSYGNFSAPMNADDSRIYQTWSGMYAAMRQINTLRELEADGLIFRQQFNEIPPHVEYGFTEMGKDLLPVFYSIMVWGFKHEKDISQ